MGCRRTVRPVTRRIAALTLGALAVLCLLVFGASRMAGGEPAAREASTQERITSCPLLQGSQVRQNEEAVTCLQSALTDAVLGGTFSQVGALATVLAQSNAHSACHAAGHRAGVELDRVQPMDKSLALMFGAGETTPEPVCVAAVVHGLVQGHVTGEPPYELEYLASQCTALEGVSTEYANECAHYFGHAVWKTVRSLTPAIGVECARLADAAASFGENACVGGAIMQMFQLQDKNYDPSIPGALERQPPQYDEIVKLCDVFNDGPESTLEGCWGGAGWLLAMRAEQNLVEDPRSGAAGHDQAVREYVRAMGLCARGSCLENLVTHFRIEDYASGVVEQVCSTPGVTTVVEPSQLIRQCDMVTARRTGSSAA
jgi:hypothetical protein